MCAPAGAARRPPRGRLQRKAYRRVVRRHHAARLVQNTLVRKYLARNDFTRRVHATWAAREVQRWLRGVRGRERLRAWNRHELLAAAYADTAKVLVKRQRAALRVRSLASTHALTTKHAAQGDLAIHRAARGVGPHAVASCIGALGMAADCYNDGGSAPLHLVGFDLDPPARIVRIREKEREKQRLWEQEQKADRAAALEAEQAFEAGKPEFLKLAQKAVKEDAAVDERDKTNTRQSMRGPHALGEQPSVAESSLGEAGAEDPTHEDTGEVRALPPSDTAEHVRDLCRKAWPKTVLKRQLVVAKDTDGDDIEVGAAEYEYDRKKHDREVAQLRREHAGATVLQTIWRRLDAIFMARLLRERRAGARGMQRLVRWRQWEDRRRLKIRMDAAATLLSKTYRGRDARRSWANFTHDLLWWRRAERHLGVKMQRLWRGHVSRRFLRRARCMKYGPQRFEAWALVVTESGEPLRKYGIYEERLYPRRFAHPKDCERIADLGPCFRDVKFYYNRVTGRCDWDMPSDWIMHDANEFRKREESRKRGFTDEEAAAASTLQAIWKGRRDRMNLKATIQGAKLMRSCEDEYLEDPMNLRKMTYYVLYLHAMTKDEERARPLYQHCMTRMRDRGPDDAWVLISYAVFCAATGDEDWPVIEECAHRGRVAPEGPLHGDRRGYDLADGGFFRAATAADPCGWTWHNYALCRWLAYGDMKGAERAFVRSVQCAPHDRLIQENFDFFLDKAYPNKRDSISCYDVIRQDATRQMVRELENEEKRRERQRNDPRVQAATMRIQMAWRRRQFFQEILGRDYFKNKREAEEKARLEALEAGEVDEEDFSEESESEASEEAASVSSVDSEEERLRGKQVRRWEEGADASGRVYWYDTVRGLSVWQEPDDLDDLVYIGKDGSQIVPQEIDSEDEEDDDPRLHPEYEEHREGRYTFYFHVPTGTSSWQRPKYPKPEELKLMAEANEQKPANDADEWEAHRDEGSGQMYFYNVSTGMSQWSHPGKSAFVKFDHGEETALVVT